MSQAKKKKNKAAALFFILAASFLMSGCAPLLVGAGAVGGYHVAKHHD